MIPRQAAEENPDMLIFYEPFEFGVAEVSKFETGEDDAFKPRKSGAT